MASHPDADLENLLGLQVLEVEESVEGNLPPWKIRPG